MAGLGGPPGLMSSSGLLLGGGGGSGSGAVVGMLIPTAAVGSAGAPASGCTSPLPALRTTTDVGLGSPTAAAAAGGSRTPGSSQHHAKGPRQLIYLGRLYGSEVVGRKCCVQLRGGARTFDKAVIVDYSDATGQHRLRHGATKAEEWVSLGEIKFYWREAAPPEAPPNPTFKPECSSEACVGRRLRVYWPAMQKWYCGSVKGYDPLTGQHTVFYKDGDQQRLVLKHEPIVWTDDEAALEASGLITFINTGEAAATTPRHPSGGTALGALGSSSGGGAGGAGLFGGAPAGLLVPQGLFGGGGAVGLVAAGVGVGAGAAGVLGSLQQQQLPQPPQPLQQQPQQPLPAEPSPTYRVIVRRCFPPTPARKGRAGGKPPSGRGGASVLGKHAREGAASADGAAAAPPKRKRGPKALRPAAMTAAAAAVVPNKHLAVNCRIGVYWRMDKAFYTGKIKAYSPQTGRFTLQYDDGQCEALLLERERFVWHSPRGATAGFKPALHALMHALGAEGVKAVPPAQQQQEGAPEGSRPPVPLTPAPEGAPHPPSSGPGAVGWRVALYWPADGAWHEAEVLSYNEPKRLHHVLYLDGEEEWLELGGETLVFLRATRSTAITAGHFLLTDDVSKKGGHDVLGWHVCVYWKDDKQFYQGQVADYNPATGKHKVVYVDGEVEELHLGNERVIWRLPPNEASESGDDAPDGDAAARAGPGPAAKRNRGRGRDSDESEDLMETEEPVTEEPTATATDDDASTGAGGGAAAGKKRGKAGATAIVKRRRRTRRGRGRPRTWHYDSDHSSDGRLLLHRHQQQPWGAHLVSSSATQHGGAAAGSGDAAGQAHQFATPRAPGMAGTDAARVLMPRQSSTGGGGGPSTAGTPAAAAGAGSMRPPAGAGGGPGTAASGLLRMSSSGLPPAAQSGRAKASVLGSSVAPNGVLQLTLPAIQVRRATGGSGDGGAGSPLLLLPSGQRLESMQLNVRIVAGGAAGDADAAGAPAAGQQRAVGSSSGSSGGAGAVAAAAAAGDGGATTEPAAGTAPAGGQAAPARVSAAAATAAALAPLLPQMPAPHQRTALRLQGKMERLDMIMGKLSATASMYGWRLDPLDPLPPLQQQARTPARRGAGRGGPGRSRSQPTSPTGVAGGGGAGGRLGLSSPRAGSGPLSPRAAAFNAARAAAGGSAGGAPNGSNAGSLPTSPRGSLGAMSPTAGGAVAASGAGLAAGRPVAVHKTCAVKSRPGTSSGSGAQRLKARPYGGAAGGAGAHSSSSTGGPGGAIAASTGGSGELTSVLQAAAAGNAISTQLQQHIQQQQQQLLQAGFVTAATGDAAAATALTAQAQLALAAAAAAKADAAAPAGAAAATAAATTAAMEALLAAQASQLGLLSASSNPAVPSSAHASEEVVLRLQALAQGSSGGLQQQLQYLQSAALATAAANAAGGGGGTKAADKAAEAAGKHK